MFPDDHVANFNGSSSGGRFAMRIYMERGGLIGRPVFLSTVH
jgi:hypothetical protein